MTRFPVSKKNQIMMTQNLVIDQWNIFNCSLYWIFTISKPKYCLRFLGSMTTLEGPFQFWGMKISMHNFEYFVPSFYWSLFSIRWDSFGYKITKSHSIFKKGNSRRLDPSLTPFGNKGEGKRLPLGRCGALRAGFLTRPAGPMKIEIFSLNFLKKFSLKYF